MHFQLLAGKIFLEIHPDYLVYLGEQKDVSKLDAVELYELIQAALALRKAEATKED